MGFSPGKVLGDGTVVEVGRSRSKSSGYGCRLSSGVVGGLVAPLVAAQGDRWLIIKAALVRPRYCGDSQGDSQGIRTQG